MVDSEPDSSFRQLRRIRAGDGLTTDLDELILTSTGTALITAYDTVGTGL